MRVLAVDDHPEVLELVARALERDGHVVHTAIDLAEARAAISELRFDVVILDLALPDGSGIELCQELRRRSEHVPVLLLTAHGEVPQRVAGLDAGADDFVAKPFAVAELRARVRALGRRGPIDRSTFQQLGEVVLDLGGRHAMRGEHEIPLTAREWAVLDLLAARKGRVVSRADILESVWGEVTDAGSASLEVIIARIRRKLGSAAIRTLRGEGYGLGDG